MSTVQTIKDCFGNDVFEGDEVAHARTVKNGLMIRKGVVSSIKGPKAWIHWDNGDKPTPVTANVILLDMFE